MTNGDSKGDMAAKHYFMVCVVLWQTLACGYAIKRSFTLKPVTPKPAETRCLYCQDAVVPSDCNTVTTCGQHEQCYVDSYVTSIGSIRYSLGCRDSLQCNSHGLVGKRDTLSNKTSELFSSINNFGTAKRSTGKLICSECCVGEICNNAGCGNTGYPVPRGPMCYNCKEQNDTNDCNKLTMCSRDEVCMLMTIQNSVTHAHRYQSKCEGKQRCEDEIQRRQMPASSTLIGRRRNSLYVGTSCDVECCSTDLCNDKCISQPVNPCFPDPCIKGTCISNITSFICHCDERFSGPTCNQATSICMGFGAYVKFKTLDSYFAKESRFYYMSNVGEFTMYESTARPFQIQIRTQPFVYNNYTHNAICAAAVQERNDVIVVEMCHGSHSTTPLNVIFPNGKLSAGTNVSRGVAHNSHVVNITFSSGAAVKVMAYKLFLRIYVLSAKEDFNATSGLCGIFDGNIDNDLTRPNQQVDFFPPHGFQNTFADSWRIPQGQSIFHKFGIRKRNGRDKDENIASVH